MVSDSTIDPERSDSRQSETAGEIRMRNFLEIEPEPEGAMELEDIQSDFWKK